MKLWTQQKKASSINVVVTTLAILGALRHGNSTQSSHSSSKYSGFREKKGGDLLVPNEHFQSLSASVQEE